MNRARFVLLLLLTTGCGGFSGGKSSKITGSAAATSAVTSANGAGLTRDAQGYKFELFYQAKAPAGDAVTALGGAPTTSASLFVATSLLGKIELADGSTSTPEAQLVQDTTSFARTTSNSFAATSNPQAARAASVWVRGSGSWGVSLDTGLREATLLEKDGQVWVFAGESGSASTATVSSGSGWSQVGSIGSSVPACATAHKGALFVGGRDSKPEGSLARLHRSQDGVKWEEIPIPLLAPAGTRSRVSGLASTGTDLFVGVETLGDKTTPPSGALLRWNESGGQLDGSFQLPDDAPVSLVAADGTVYAATRKGKLLYRDATGNWLEESGVPANGGFSALTLEKQVLYVGARATSSSTPAVWRRTPLSGIALTTSGTTTGTGTGTGTPPATLKTYLADVKPLLNDCVTCHATTVPALKVDLKNDTADYNAVRGKADLANPEASPVLKKPTGETAHGGGVRFAKGSAAYNAILQWIKDGAKFN